jgi:hypothetical protein
MKKKKIVERGIGRSVSTLKGVIRFQSSTIDGLGLIIADFNPCPYPCLLRFVHGPFFACIARI